MKGGPRRISPFFIPASIINLAAGQVSIRFSARGPNLATCTACTASAHAIGEAFEIIRRGDADVMIAGGSEAAITPMGVGGFAAMRALSTRNDDPQHASRPFDKDRDGFVMGEGAGIVILEELEVGAPARRADLRRAGRLRPDLRRLSPHRAARGRARRRPLDDTWRCGRRASRPTQVDYINAHGTSTPINDPTETLAVKRLFGEHAYKLAMSSTKSMTGHLLGAAGGLEAGITALAIKHQIVPPTINLDNPDPECDLDYVPHKARPMKIHYALSNSFGFGGTNGTLSDEADSSSMKIAVCIKQVVTREWQVRVNDQKTWIRDQDASFELNEPDAYALEEALRLKEKHGGEVIVCSAGPARATQVIREALARGADRAIHVESRCPGHCRRQRRRRGARRRDQRRTGRSGAHRACSPTTRASRRSASSWPRSSACRTPRSSWKCRSPMSGLAREARARRRLVPVGRAAAAGAADDPERHQPAPLRDAQGHHGGEEEGDQEGRAGRRGAARPAHHAASTFPRRARRPS